MSVYFSGMISGLDTEQLIQQLMALERRPITLMQQKLSRIEEQQAAWRDVNTRLSNLESKLEDLLSSAAFEEKSATSSDESVVQATADARALAGTYSVVVTQRATVAQWNLTASMDPETGGLAQDGTLVFTIGGSADPVTVDYGAGETLQALADRINEHAGLEIQATVIEETLVLKGVKSGAANDFAVDGDPSLTATRVGGAAQDAVAIIDGVTVTSPSNTLQTAGLTLELVDVGGPVTVAVRQDLDEIVSKIKTVVDQYNSFYTFAQEKLAKEAVLQGDSALIQLVARVREALTDRVGTGGGLDQLAIIGITTTREGRLTIDESTLREKLAEDPAAVERLFTAEEETDGVAGVARRAVSIIEQYTRSSGLISSRQSMYDGMIDDINEQIDSLEMRLDLREQNLRAQFVRMEQMLATLQAQSNALAGQLAQIGALASGGGGSAS